MTAPTNTVTSLTAIGQRESLSDIIYRVAPEDTPFFSMIKKEKAKARAEEWQTESLRTPVATNYQLEGDDVGTVVAGNTSVRVKNYCQIFRESGAVSETANEVDLAGRKSEMARQKSLKGLEIRTDVEMSFLSNNASREESGADARVSGGIQAWLTTNTDRGSGGSDGGYSAGIAAAATTGTNRAFSEAQVKSIMASVYDAGGKVSVCMVDSAHKQDFSAFSGIADIRAEVKGQDQATLYAAADVYVSDFGSVSIVPHRYALSEEALFITPSMASVKVLRGFKTKALAKSGDNDKFLMTYEATLCVKNEKAHGIVADLS